MGRNVFFDTGMNHRRTATRFPVRIVIVACVVLSAVQSAASADPAAGFLTKLFITSCVPNLGQPVKVREWAQEHQLAEIQNPVALGVFVGPGDKGAAWTVPSAQGNFALSIRGTTQACAVWARAADPAQTLALFQKLIEGVKRPGIEITVDMDKVSPSPVGDAHALVYNMTAPNAPASFEFTLLTAERAGGAFQASMQAAKAGPHQASPK
jgi:hypothetical protein